MKLSERLLAGDGPDRLLDANIHWRLHRDDFEADDDHTDETYCYARHGWTMNRADHMFLGTFVPRYTASLDAALSLHHGVKPDTIPTNPRKAAAEALEQRGL